METQNSRNSNSLDALNIGKVINRDKSFRVNPCFRGKNIYSYNFSRKSIEL